MAEGTLDFMLRELLLPEGGFASALDADTDGDEGVTYVWTPSQLRRVLGGPDADAAIVYYGVSEAGNFEGANILRPAGPPPADLADIRSRLLEARTARRSRVATTRRSAAWNGLALAALAEGGWRLRRPDLTAAGVELAGFLVERMTDSDGRLLRTYRDGQAAFRPTWTITRRSPTDCSSCTPRPPTGSIWGGRAVGRPGGRAVRR